MTRLPDALREALEAFPGTHPMLRVWRHYPHVPDSDDGMTDWWACQQASEQFVTFLAGRGITARCVLAQDAEAAFHDDHWWVRIDHPHGTVNVDWTARQFHNLAHPPDPAHADLPFPLVWHTSPACPADTHPVTGRYGRVTDPAPTSHQPTGKPGDPSSGGTHDDPTHHARRPDAA